MRILLVEFIPAGGLYQFALQLADGLARQGHDVELLTGRRPELAPREPRVRLLPVLPVRVAEPREEPAALAAVRRVGRAGRYLVAWWRAGGHVLRTRPDVVQWSEWRFALDGVLATALARLYRHGVLADVAHTPRPFTERRSTERTGSAGRADSAGRAGSAGLHKQGRLLPAALGAAYARMDVVFVLGERSRADLRAAFPRVRRVEVVPHGDERIYADDVPSPEHSPATVLFFGALARYKGLDLLLDAWPLVRREHPAARLVIAGAVVDVDVAALRRRAGQIGGVDLRPGYVAAADVAGLVGGARLLVLPYRTAYQSGVVHLAHTLGRPVVATDVGDVAAAVGAGGLVVPPDDPVALAAALTRLIADPAWAARLGATGQARVGSQASWDTVAERVAGVYAELRGGRP